MPENMRPCGASNQQVGRAGEYFVVAQLNKRGAFAVPFAGNMPKIDIIACNSDKSRTIIHSGKNQAGWKDMAFKHCRQSAHVTQV